MRDLKSGAEKPKSFGFGFVAFEEHADAMKTLQSLNNNPDILGGNRVCFKLSLVVSTVLFIIYFYYIFAAPNCGIFFGKLARFEYT